MAQNCIDFINYDLSKISCNKSGLEREPQSRKSSELKIEFNENKTFLKQCNMDPSISKNGTEIPSCARKRKCFNELLNVLSNESNSSTLEAQTCETGLNTTICKRKELFRSINTNLNSPLCNFILNNQTNADSLESINCDMDNNLENNNLKINVDNLQLENIRYDIAKDINSNEMTNCNLIKELPSLEFVRIPDDLKSEKKTIDVNSCNRAFCHETIATDAKTTSSNKPISEMFKSGANELGNDYTMRLIDKNIMEENFNIDFKSRSSEKMGSEDCLAFKKTFNYKNDSSPIVDTYIRNDSDTLILYIDESDIDCNSSDDEEIKNIRRTENGGTNFEELRDNNELSSPEQICTNNDICKSIRNIPCEDYNSKIERFPVCNYENDLKKTRTDQQLVSIRNTNIPHDIQDQKINVLHISDSKEDFKISNINQQPVDIQDEDPDILKIFYDESDIDLDYKSDSEIDEKNEEVEVLRLETNENVTNFIKKDICDTDVSASIVANNINTNILNDIVNDNNEIKSELDSLSTVEIVHDVENTNPDYYEEEEKDLFNTGWNKIKSLSTDEERYRQVSDCWQSPSIPNPTKNLTYYSFRKRLLLSSGDDVNQRRPLKRSASSNFNDQDAKRVRLCTYIVDDRIKSIEDEKNAKIKELREKFDLKIKERYMNHHSLEKRLEQRHLKKFGTIRNYKEINRAKLQRIKDQFGREIKNIEIRYKNELKCLQKQFISKINCSYKKRREIMEFCNFYKMSETNSAEDPTLLTQRQQLILDEIENIYKQLDLFYSSE